MEKKIILVSGKQECEKPFRLKASLDLNQHLPDVLEDFNNLKVSFSAILVFPEFLLCSPQGQAPDLHQFMDKIEIIDVLNGKKAVALFVLFRLYNIKFLFPVAYKGGIDIEHVCNLSDGVV